GLVGTEGHRRPGVGTEGAELRLGEELRDRRSGLPVLAVDDVRESLRPPLLRVLLELGQLGARVLLGHGQVADRGRIGKDPELRAARDLGRVLDLETETEVGLVGAVAQHRLRVGEPLERRLELYTERLAPDAL